MEELEGLKGEPYKINKRSNKAYKILEKDIDLLTGVFGDVEEIRISYKSTIVPSSVNIVPKSMVLAIGETKEFDYELDVTGNFNENVEFIVSGGGTIVTQDGNKVTGVMQGSVPIKVFVTGDGFELEDSGLISVTDIGD